jgi:hypothetical protein
MLQKNGSFSGMATITFEDHAGFKAALEMNDEDFG